MCRVIFHHSKQATMHWLHHAQVFETMNCSNDQASKHCPQCAPHWVNLRRMMSHFALEVEFYPPNPEPAADNVSVVNFLNDAPTETTEDMEVQGILGKLAEPVNQYKADVPIPMGPDPDEMPTLAAESLNFVDE